MSSKVVRRYYCVPCYRALERAASKAIPDLTKDATDKAAGQQLAVLLGVETGRKSVEGTNFELEPIPPLPDADESFKLADRDVSIDIKLSFPSDMVPNRVPFERFYDEARKIRKSAAK